MSYVVKEASLEAGSPVELYDILLGSDVEYHHTSGEDPITADSQLYTPLAIARDAVTAGGESRSTIIAITMPASHPFPQAYVNVVPGERATFTIRRFHRTDTDTEIVELYKGRVQSVSFSQNGAVSTVSIMPLTGEQVRTIPLFVYSGLCNHVLGQQTPLGGCPVDLEAGVSPINGLAFRHVGNVTLVNVNVLTVAGANAFPDGWFNNGFVKTAASDYRLILEHTGNTLRLLLPFTADLTGASVNVYAGCNHDPVTCVTKFDVMDDYGGYSGVPTLNPFNTTLGK